MKKKSLVLAGALVLGMALVLSGCEKGGTVTFTNDVDTDVSVTIVAYTGSTPSSYEVTAQTLEPGKYVTASLDDDGKYIVSGSVEGNYFFEKGALAGSETRDFKASQYKP